jgi:hypothetical protein
MKMVDIEILLKAVETKVALVLFLALLVGFSALWFVTRVDVIPLGEGITVGSSEEYRRTSEEFRRTLMPTAPVPRRESSQE